MTDLAKEYFTDDELKCKCGCEELIFDQNARIKLNLIREDWGKPMIVSSGYRCPNHPLEVHKNATGEHSTGMCVDIRISGLEAFDLAALARRHGVKRIGMNQKGNINGRFVHLGWNDNFPDSCWTY